MTRSLRTSHITRVSSVLVTVCFVYQLAACPCGCAEHNYWLQLCGLVEGELQASQQTGGLVSISLSEAHICDHEPHDQFVNTARSLPSKAGQPRSGLIAVLQPGQSLVPARCRLLHERGPPGRLAERPIRSSLQVFLL